MKSTKVFYIRHKLYCMGQETQNDMRFLRTLEHKPEYANEKNPDIKEMTAGTIDFLLKNLDDQKTRIEEIREVLLQERERLAREERKRIKKLGQYVRETALANITKKENEQ